MKLAKPIHVPCKPTVSLPSCLFVRYCLDYWKLETNSITKAKANTLAVVSQIPLRTLNDHFWTKLVLFEETDILVHKLFKYRILFKIPFRNGILETDDDNSCHAKPGHKGAQWLSGRVLDSRPRGRGFEPHRRHCVLVLEQDTFIPA